MLGWRRAGTIAVCLFFWLWFELQVNAPWVQEKWYLLNMSCQNHERNNSTRIIEIDMCPSALHLSTHPSDKRSKTMNCIVDRKLQTQEQLENILSDHDSLGRKLRGPLVHRLAADCWLSNLSHRLATQRHSGNGRVISEAARTLSPTWKSLPPLAVQR